MEFYEHLLVILGLGGVAGAITAVGNGLFDQGWGIGIFLLIWLISFCVVYGGFLILDSSDF